MYNPGDNYYVEFITVDEYGLPTTADSLPTVTANKNGVDDLVDFVLTAALIGADAGRYKATGTIPNDYIENDSVSVSVEATVDGEYGWVVIDKFIIEVGDVDSTDTETITYRKALEIILAMVMGETVVSTVDSDTKRVQFLGRDGATVIAQVDVSSVTSGLREDSLIDPP